jgi:hypothetical protein
VHTLDIKCGKVLLSEAKAEGLASEALVGKMKFVHRMLTFGVVLVAALMAVNEVPELLTLTDNVSNDYVSVRAETESPRRDVIKDSTRHLTVAPMVSNPTVRLRVATACNFLFSLTAKSPRSLLLLLVTQRN